MWLINNVVVASGEQQSDSATDIHVSVCRFKSYPNNMFLHGFGLWTSSGPLRSHPQPQPWGPGPLPPVTGSRGHSSALSLFVRLSCRLPTLSISVHRLMIPTDRSHPALRLCFCPRTLYISCLFFPRKDLPLVQTPVPGLVDGILIQSRFSKQFSPFLDALLITGD